MRWLSSARTRSGVLVFVLALFSLPQVGSLEAQSVSRGAGQGKASRKIGPTTATAVVKANKDASVDLLSRAGANKQDPAPVVGRILTVDPPPASGGSVSDGPLEAEMGGAKASSEGKVTGEPISKGNPPIVNGLRAIWEAKVLAEASATTDAEASASQKDPLTYEEIVSGEMIEMSFLFEQLVLEASGEGFASLFTDLRSDVAGLESLFALSIWTSGGALSIDFVSNDALGLSDSAIEQMLYRSFVSDSAGRFVLSATEVFSTSLAVPQGVASMTFNDSYDMTAVAPVPEPATVLLLGSGLAGLAGAARRRRRPATAAGA